MAINTASYARRLGEIQPFRVMKLLARANELANQGGNVIHMEVGEPDFPTPAPIIQAGQQALLEGRTRYTPASGIPELREAVSGFYRSHYNLDISPERIFITAGGSGALLLTSALLLNHGEGLLMTDPGYPYELLQDKRGHLVVDEIYHGPTYQHPGKKRNLSVLEVGQQAFVINSFSKYFGMTGWRLGWLVAPGDAIEELEKLAQNLFICPSSIAQYAALSAFSADSMEIMEKQRAIFAERRDFLVPALKKLGFSIPRLPEGAFYVYAGLLPGSAASEKFCDDLLEQYLVAITPGTDFGFHRADEHVRITYAEDIDRLAEATQRIEKALSG